MPTLEVGKEYIINVPDNKDKRLLFGKLHKMHVVVTEVTKDYFKFVSKDAGNVSPGFLFMTHAFWLEPVANLCKCSVSMLMISGCQCGGV